MTGGERCLWCGAIPSSPFTLRPARWGTDKRTGLRICKRPAVTSPACAACAERMAPSSDQETRIK